MNANFEHNFTVFFSDLFLTFGAHNLWIALHHTATVTQLTVIDVALTTMVVGRDIRKV
jgi:hypothetical protein